MPLTAFFTAVPLRVDEAIRPFRYIPYMALLAAARARAARGVSAFTVNDKGELVRQELDRVGERDLSTAEWTAVANTVARLTREYLGAERGRALDLHNEHVHLIHLCHGWAVATEYDILQRETLAVWHTVDISVTSCQPTHGHPYSTSLGAVQGSPGCSCVLPACETSS